MLEKIFKLKENNTTVRTEILAGITTFITISYIFVVLPGIVATPFEGELKTQIFNSVFLATCIVAFLSTFLMGIWAKLPFVLAPGLGLTSFFTYSVMIGMGYSFSEGLAIVFLSGMFFIFITVIGLREKLIVAIPHNIKIALSAGIGLFLAFVGLKNAGIIVSNSATFVALADFSHIIQDPIGSQNLIFSLLGLFFIAALYKFNIKGYLLISIIFTTIISIFTGEVSLNLNAFNITTYINDFTTVSLFSCFDGFKSLFSMSSIIQSVFTIFILMISFTIVDMFDSIGVLLGTAKKAGFLDENGNLPHMKQALMCDAIGTTAGSMLGTPTVTTYVESTAGISAGGRTGLTSVVTSILLLSAIILAPFVSIIPVAATAPILIFLGSLMLNSIVELNFEDITEIVPAFLTIILMPLTFSIANGIAFGIISYFFIKVFTGKFKEIKPITAILAIIFTLRYLYIHL